MKCPMCMGKGKLETLIFGSAESGYREEVQTCFKCKGTGEYIQTNFERITESPEALATFLEEYDKEYVNGCDFIGGCLKCPLEGKCTQMKHDLRELWMWWLKEKTVEKGEKQ